MFPSFSVVFQSAQGEAQGQTNTTRIAGETTMETCGEQTHVCRQYLGSIVVVVLVRV